MKTKKNIPYIAVTALAVLAILPGAIMNIVQPDILVEMAGILGVPLALMTLMGIWKLLGVVALVTPKFPRLKEWAYAGFFFDLTGASYLHASAGDLAGIAPPLVILAVLMGSRLLYHKSTTATMEASSTASNVLTKQNA